MITFRHEMQLCPKCGYELDAATKVEGDQGAPEPNDVTVCIQCASVLQFGPELKLTAISLDDVPAAVRKSLEKVIEEVNKMWRKR